MARRNEAQESSTLVLVASAGAGRPLARKRADCALPPPNSLPGGTTGNKKQHSGPGWRPGVAYADRPAARWAGTQAPAGRTMKNTGPSARIN
jgi:hypothetical protein